MLREPGKRPLRGKVGAKHRGEDGGARGGRGARAPALPARNRFGEAKRAAVRVPVDGPAGKAVHPQGGARLGPPAAQELKGARARGLVALMTAKRLFDPRDRGRRPELAPRVRRFGAGPSAAGAPAHHQGHGGRADHRLVVEHPGFPAEGQANPWGEGDAVVLPQSSTVRGRVSPSADPAPPGRACKLPCTGPLGQMTRVFLPMWTRVAETILLRTTGATALPHPLNRRHRAG